MNEICDLSAKYIDTQIKYIFFILGGEDVVYVTASSRFL